MLFSVLIAHYNNTRFLPAALDSVLCQTYDEWEIILVDDCSTEDFDQTIKPYLNQERIRVYRNINNFGCGYTKHKCADLASGSLMAFLDPDDVLLPDALKRMTLVHRLRPDCSIAHSTHFVCEVNLEGCRPAEYVKSIPEGVSYLLLSDGRVHHFATFKKSAYLRSTGIDPHNKKAVDQDLYYLLEEQGTIVFLDEPLYKYRIHEGGISTSGREEDATRWHQKIIMKACMRRMDKLASDGLQKSQPYQQIKRRYAQVRIQHEFRTGKWARLIIHIMIYPFQSGSKHMFAYLKKLLRQGPEILNRTFRYDHRILP
jgi:glycosyltransferase involved in cell wall biosynthesis